MPKTYSYTDAGVNREQRTESKKALKILEPTYKHSHHGQVMRLPYGNIFPQTEDTYLDLVIEGFGTKAMPSGTSAPIYLEIQNGVPKLYVWADINEEDPTHIIDLSGAKEEA